MTDETGKEGGGGGDVQPFIDIPLALWRGLVTSRGPRKPARAARGSGKEPWRDKWTRPVYNRVCKGVKGHHGLINLL